MRLGAGRSFPAEWRHEQLALGPDRRRRVVLRQESDESAGESLSIGESDVVATTPVKSQVVPRKPQAGESCLTSSTTGDGHGLGLAARTRCATPVWRRRDWKRNQLRAVWIRAGGVA